jgi:hypothetical protein
MLSSKIAEAMKNAAMLAGGALLGKCVEILPCWCIGV